MRNYEKRSFFTTLVLFFIPLFLLSSVVLYMYHQEEIEEMEKNILYEMKDYSYDFKGDDFSLDIVEENKFKQVFTIYHDNGGLYAYFEIPSKGPYLLKIIFDEKKYQKLYKQMLKKIFEVGIIIFFLILLISIGFSFYSLRPMKQALYLLEDFLKDLIHDLNTPATSILLNARLLRKKGDFEEINRIELSAKSIASLYKNLELINPISLEKNETVDLEKLTEQKIVILQKMYPTIVFKKKAFSKVIKSNKNALDRILDNLLTNACKYNKKNGYVSIELIDNKIIIEDNGIGIKNTQKVFHRYYKENENGMGIGLNIVKQLCDILNITIKIRSTLGIGTSVELSFSE